MGVKVPATHQPRYEVGKFKANQALPSQRGECLWKAACEEEEEGLGTLEIN